MARVVGVTFETESESRPGLFTIPRAVAEFLRIKDDDQVELAVLCEGLRVRVATRLRSGLEVYHRQGDASTADLGQIPANTPLTVTVWHPGDESAEQEPATSWDRAREPASAELPPEVSAVISKRGSGSTRPLAELLAQQALTVDGVQLSGQQSKGEPRYFQIRHRDHPYVVAYVNVRGSDLAVDYRLPRDYALTGREERRNNTHAITYGIRLKVRDSADLEDAMRLLQEAIHRRE